jgi:hypothetical protein
MAKPPVSQKTYDKYLRKYDPQAPENVQKRKAEKVQRRKQWWSANWIALSSLAVSVMALIVAVIALRQ